MDKPTTMRHREFKTYLISLINESGLPAFVLVPVMEQALSELKAIEEQQYLEDKANYEAEGKEDGKDI